MDDLTFRQLKESKYYHPILTDVMFDHTMMLNMIYDSISVTDRGYDAVIDSAMFKFTIRNFKHGVDLIDKRVKERGIKVSFDITKDNLNFVNKIKHHDIRHLNGIYGE